MAAALRQFRILGYLVNEPVTAIVTVNGVEVFNGQIEISGDPPTPPATVPIVYGQYEGDDSVDQTFPITIYVVSGSAAFGMVEVDSINPEPNNWQRPSNPTNDGRTNILFNDALPGWPWGSTPDTLGGTPENPIWKNWAFLVEGGDLLSFNYTALPPSPSV